MHGRAFCEYVPVSDRRQTAPDTEDRACSPRASRAGSGYDICSSGFPRATREFGAASPPGTVFFTSPTGTPTLPFSAVFGYQPENGSLVIPQVTLFKKLDLAGISPEHWGCALYGGNKSQNWRCVTRASKAACKKHRKPMVLLKPWDSTDPRCCRQFSRRILKTQHPSVARQRRRYPAI